MGRLRDIVTGAVGALCAVALVAIVNARQQVSQPGVVPGPTAVQLVGPTPLVVSGTVTAQQVGPWTVTAEQAHPWTVRLAEPAPIAAPAFIHSGGCYVFLADAGGNASAIYRVGQIAAGWIHIEPVRAGPGTLPAGWINVSRLTLAAESKCSVTP